MITNSPTAGGGNALSWAALAIALLAVVISALLSTLGWKKSFEAGIRQQQEAQRLGLKEQARRDLVGALDAYIAWVDNFWQELRLLSRLCGLRSDDPSVEEELRLLSGRLSGLTFPSSLMDWYGFFFDYSSLLPPVGDVRHTLEVQSLELQQLLWAVRQNVAEVADVKSDVSIPPYLLKLARQGRKAVSTHRTLCRQVRSCVQHELLVRLFDPAAGKCSVPEELPRIDFSQEPWVIVGDLPSFPVMKWNEYEDED